MRGIPWPNKRGTIRHSPRGGQTLLLPTPNTLYNQRPPERTGHILHCFPTALRSAQLNMASPRVSIIIAALLLAMVFTLTATTDLETAEQYYGHHHHHGGPGYHHHHHGGGGYHHHGGGHYHGHHHHHHGYYG